MSVAKTFELHKSQSEMAHFTSVETMMLMCDLSSSSIVFVMTFWKNALQNAHKYEGLEQY
jgi:hypothetical protein